MDGVTAACERAAAGASILIRFVPIVTVFTRLDRAVAAARLRLANDHLLTARHAHDDRKRS
jgi:hypothetical protein